MSKIRKCVARECDNNAGAKRGNKWVCHTHKNWLAYNSGLEPYHPRLTELEDLILEIIGMIPAFTVEIDRQFLTAKAVLSTEQFDREALARLNLIFPRSYFGGDIHGKVTTLVIPVLNDKDLRVAY